MTPCNNSIRSMSSSTSPKGIAAIVGVGPKLGRSVARKFAHEGYTVAILSRDLTNLSRFADEIACEAKAQVFAIRIDCSNSKSVREAFEGVLSLGAVEALVYNACEPAPPCQPTSFMSLTLESFERSLAVCAVGAFNCAQQVIPGCGKFALRGLSQSLAREFQSAGIHIAHVVIDGAIGESRSSRGDQSSTVDHSSMNPDALAQTYWHIHTQDKGAWTQEMDLRSASHRF